MTHRAFCGIAAHASSRRSLVLFVAPLLLSLVFLGGACNDNSGAGMTSAPGAPTCAVQSGPPTDTDLRCRLLKASFDGKLKKHIAEADADILVSNFRAMRQAQHDWQEQRLSKNDARTQIDKIDNSCVPIVGLSCAELFLGALDR
jgi:hypothetical protein